MFKKFRNKGLKVLDNYQYYISHLVYLELKELLCYSITKTIRYETTMNYDIKKQLYVKVAQIKATPVRMAQVKVGTVQSSTSQG